MINHKEQTNRRQHVRISKNKIVAEMNFQNNIRNHSSFSKMSLVFIQLVNRVFIKRFLCNQSFSKKESVHAATKTKV